MPKPETIASTTRAWLKVPIPTSPADPTSDVVEIAIVPARTKVADIPAPSWLTAAWEPSATPPTARLLIGTGLAWAPTVGTWDVWVRVHDSPETPVLRSGSFVVE